ncbi:MAG: hypothetical protein MK101_12245, partial [Phycisphaerales bacterium]|nr:hypothetical protein [Phycisphaerales bacterium]
VFRNCRFLDNVSLLHGGAIAIEHGVSAEVDLSEFRGNITYANGGGISLIGGVMDVRDTQFVGNQANGGTGTGGGASVEQGLMIVEDCGFETNTAYLGGALYGSTSAVVTVTGSSFCGSEGGHVHGNVDLVPGSGNCNVFDCSMPCRSDINGDARTGIDDLLLVVDQWGQCPDLTQDCSADIDVSHRVDVEDMLEVMAGWGECVQ